MSYRAEQALTSGRHRRRDDLDKLLLEFNGARHEVCARSAKSKIELWRNRADKLVWRAVHVEEVESSAVERIARVILPVAVAPRVDERFRTEMDVVSQGTKHKGRLRIPVFDEFGVCAPVLEGFETELRVIFVKEGHEARKTMLPRAGVGCAAVAGNLTDGHVELKVTHQVEEAADSSSVFNGRVRKFEALALHSGQRQHVCKHWAVGQSMNGCGNPYLAVESRAVVVRKRTPSAETTLTSPVFQWSSSTID